MSPQWLALGRQFMKFALVGVSGAVVDFTVYLLLTRRHPWWLEHFLLANIVSFVAANFNNYLWHRRWTFVGRTGGWLQQYLWFLGVSSFYLLFIQVTLWVLVRHFGWYDILAKLVAVGVGVFVYFTVVRRYIFDKPATAVATG